MKRIAIIGAGISGLFLANLLEKEKTFSYKIFEKKESLDLSDGYGIQLSVNSIHLLNKVAFNKISTSDVCSPKKVNFNMLLFYPSSDGIKVFEKLTYEYMGIFYYLITNKIKPLVLFNI